MLKPSVNTIDYLIEIQNNLIQRRFEFIIICINVVAILHSRDIYDRTFDHSIIL